MFKLDKVISGGQTGADRGGLDAALSMGVPIGGWCPRGRWAEDGVIPSVYTLEEVSGYDLLERTFLNIEDADATLLVTQPKLQQGSLRTYQHAYALKLPLLHLRVNETNLESRLVAWLLLTKPKVLNVAGSRESSWPGIQKLVATTMQRAFTALR